MSQAEKVVHWRIISRHSRRNMILAFCGANCPEILVDGCAAYLERSCDGYGSLWSLEHASCLEGDEQSLAVLGTHPFDRHAVLKAPLSYEAIQLLEPVINERVLMPGR